MTNHPGDIENKTRGIRNFHNVQIPDSLLSYAFTLAERYMCADNTLDNTLLLLDSSAARAGLSEQTEALSQENLLNVLSTWTQMPVAQLSPALFNLDEFVHSMQQRVFGQDAALTVIAHKLQQSQSLLHPQAGPFCTFLFAGPEHAGKKTAAHALTEHLFRQIHVLYYAQLAATRVTSIADIKLQRSQEHHYSQLKEVIRQMPYAVIMLENVDQAAPNILDGLFEIFSTGYLHDNDGYVYNFRQSVIIQHDAGSQRLSELAF